MLLKLSVLALLPMAFLISCGQPAAVQIRDAWARDTVGRTANAAVFMTISTEADDRLISASSAVARKTDLMIFEGGTGAMRMRYVDGIDVPARKPVRLSPKGLHIWLDGLDRALTQGTNIPLTLRFEKAGTVAVSVAVIAPGAPAPRPGS